MSNISKLDGISTVEDLTDAAAAVVEGGGGFGNNLNFDSFQATKPFRVSRGKSVAFSASAKEGGSVGTFNVFLRNSVTRRTTSPQTLFAVGVPAKTSWSNMRGGSYQVVLNDTKDGEIITGSYSVSFS